MDDGGALNSIAQSHPSYMNPFGFYDIESIQSRQDDHLEGLKTEEGGGGVGWKTTARDSDNRGTQTIKTKWRSWGLWPRDTRVSHFPALGLRQTKRRACFDVSV